MFISIRHFKRSESDLADFVRVVLTETLNHVLGKLPASIIGKTFRQNKFLRVWKSICQLPFAISSELGAFPYSVRGCHILRQNRTSIVLLWRISLLLRHQKEPFLDKIVTSYEKWIVYDNLRRQRSWKQPCKCAEPVSKSDLLQMKVLLYFWWHCVFMSVRSLMIISTRLRVKRILLCIMAFHEPTDQGSPQLLFLLHLITFSHLLRAFTFVLLSIYANTLIMLLPVSL